MFMAVLALVAVAAEATQELVLEVHQNTGQLFLGRGVLKEPKKRRDCTGLEPVR